MEHIITITSSGAQSAFPESQFTAACDYVFSLVYQGIDFTYTRG